MRNPDRIVRAHVRSNVVVTRKDGSTFRGVLIDADLHSLILNNASLLEERGDVPVDGTVLLFRADVAYMQMP